MESNKLAQQIQQKASSVDRLSGMMEASQDTYFEGWKSKADGIWSKKMANYQNTMEGALQLKTEGVALLADAPVFYKMGEVGYKYAPELVQSGFDSIAESSAWGMASEAAGAASEAVGAAAASIRTGATELGSRIAASIAPAPIAAETEMAGGEVGEFASQTAAAAAVEPAAAVLDDTLLGAETGTEIAALAEEETEITGAEAGLGAEEAVETGAGIAGAETAGVAGAEAAALTGEAALAETGIGAPVAAVAAAATAIGFGLYDLFGGHHHSAPALQKPPPPLQNRYSIAASILPSTQAAVSGGAAMVF